ncbi:MAG: putative motility protein [Acidobacteria bacterium]|nr:putative motility protein [Acidobacteriota bacterium]
MRIRRTFMDISPASVLLARQLQTQAAFSMQVMRKVLDFQTQQGEDLVRLMAQAAGLGQVFDAQA